MFSSNRKPGGVFSLTLIKAPVASGVFIESHTHTHTHTHTDDAVTLTLRLLVTVPSLNCCGKQNLQDGASLLLGEEMLQTDSFKKRTVVWEMT
jgi:hypothetical protein